ncbi:probable hypoxia-inducible factor 1-alpha inhibitor [Coccomyxa sp. Obi]|nr:probable hypoxia-inducible factor 1-alpha inhibitor [Coccomyxa sp. Obi]
MVTNELAVRTEVAIIAPANGKGHGKLKLRNGTQTPVDRAGQQSALAFERQGVRGPAPRYPKWIAENEIERFDVSDAKGHNAAWEVLRTCQPAVLCKSPLVQKLLERWTLPYLAKAFGMNRADVEVLSSEEKSSAFVEHDESKNAFGSFYHVREPATQRLHMTFSDFIDCLSTWKARKAFVRTPVMTGRSIDNSARPCDDLGTALQDDLTSSIDWQWLEEAQNIHRWGGLRGVNLEVGSCNGLQPARYHTHDRLLAQVAGRRRVLLISPAYAHAGMYAFPLHHPYDGYAMPDLDRPDTAAWPLLRRVRGHAAVLQPGDGIFVPAYWRVPSSLPVNLSDLDMGATTLGFELGQGMRLQSRDAMWVAISRLIEERVGQLQGVADVRRWLLTITRGEEESCIDPATVRGYRQLVMCQEVRDEIEAVLGADASVAELLTAIGAHTLWYVWLQNFREPLYLTDKPLQLPDNRTEEEIKYPELFRHRLIGCQ